MSKLPVLPSCLHKVSTHEVDGLLGEYEVLAAYFQETGRFTVFKDDTHAVVDAFRTDTVLRIKREDVR